MYDFWYDYEKPKYDEKVKLCYMDLDSFLVYIKNDDIYIYGFWDIAEAMLKQNLILEIMS